MTRLLLGELPGTAMEALAIELDSEVQRYEPLPASVDGHALVARLDLDDGRRVVLKAAYKQTDAAALIEREAWARTSTTGIPGPPLIWAGTVDQIRMIVTRFINDQYRTPSLTPGSPDLDPVLDALAVMGPRLTAASAPGGVALVQDDFRQVRQDAGRICNPKTLPAPELDIWQTALYLFDLEAVVGSTLLHGELVPRHLLVAPGQLVVVTDWSQAAYGAEWAGLVPLGVHLVAAGWSPSRAEELLAASFPCWRDTSDDAVTGLIATWTLHKALVASRTARPTPIPPIRPAGLSWLEHRLSPG